MDEIQPISIIKIACCIGGGVYDRVLGTVGSYQCDLPDKRIIVNLSPAEQRKNSPIFDLAMAIGMMEELDYFSHDIPKTGCIS